jgi:hypothetical protein
MEPARPEKTHSRLTFKTRRRPTHQNTKLGVQMAGCWIARTGRPGAFAVAGLALLMGLAGSLAMAQELSWPPSTADGVPHIDHTRKVLHCGSEGCRLTIVRSQEELLQAMSSSATFSPAPTAPTLHVVSSDISAEQQAEIQHRIQNSQQQIRVSLGMTLILGGCFGGDLPWQVGGEKPRATLPPEVAEHFRAIEGSPPVLAKTSK